MNIFESVPSLFQTTICNSILKILTNQFDYNQKNYSITIQLFPFTISFFEYQICVLQNTFCPTGTMQSMLLWKKLVQSTFKKNSQHKLSLQCPLQSLDFPSFLLWLEGSKIKTQHISNNHISNRNCYQPLKQQCISCSTNELSGPN